MRKEAGVFENKVQRQTIKRTAHRVEFQNIT
jgi:hypothetical protein